MINAAAVKAVFERSLKLFPDERCVIVTDTIKEPLARPFYEYAKHLCSETNIAVMEPLTHHGTEPPETIRKQLLTADVALLITEKSLSHTSARRDASARGARIASMPGITADSINRCLDVDYERIRSRSITLAEQIGHAHEITVTSHLGTDMHFTIGGRNVYHGEGGIFTHPGAFGNLPEGEVCLCPREADGVFVVDASFALLGKIESPLTFTVKDNVVIEITGERADEIKKVLNNYGVQGYTIAEFGIGTHDQAIVTGKVLEDEKVIGTCHIAVGNNMSFGGENAVPIHFDGVIQNARISIDTKLILDKGRLFVE